MGAKSCAVLADTVLILHIGFVLFVVGGALVARTGYFARWRFVRNPWFRAVHLLAMAVVVAESLFGVICPLTTWEAALRVKAGKDPSYAGSFMHRSVPVNLSSMLPLTLNDLSSAASIPTATSVSSLTNPRPDNAPRSSYKSVPPNICPPLLARFRSPLKSSRH
jgi:hypothetical protein